MCTTKRLHCLKVLRLEGGKINLAVNIPHYLVIAFNFQSSQKKDGFFFNYKKEGS